MSNINGKLIQQTLMKMKGPVTMKELVAILAERTQTDPEYVKPQVVEILKNGAEYGFIQCKRRRYYVEALDDETVEILRNTEMDFNESSEGPSRSRSQSRGGVQKRVYSKRRQ